MPDIDSTSGLSPARDVQPLSTPPEAGGFRTALRDALLDMESDRRRIDALIAGGHRRQLEQTDLLALQGRVYRYVQHVELTSRLVDKCASAVRTTLQAQ